MQKKHSEYKELVTSLKARKLSDTAEERYLGYVAMSNVKEGGWFSELNVLPLNPGNKSDLPDIITFYVKDGPSLMSADNQAWNSFARLMINSAQESVEDALIEIKKNNFQFRLDLRVMSAKQLFNPDFFYRDMCAFTKNKMAIRFAFYDIPKKLFDVKEQTTMADQWLRLHRARCLSSRPIIFTYSDGFPEDKVSRSVEEVNVWKIAWSAAGYEPFVLNTLDARRHPGYPELQNIFKQLKAPLGAHNEACYLRWLAISSSGGGYMSDVDIFPLHMPSDSDNILPNNGNFTSYERHIPCFISANAREWDRVRVLLQQNLIEHKNQFWSDLFAFQAISEQNNNAYILGSEALPINRIYSSIQSSSDVAQSINSFKDVCPITNRLRAIHFSPFAISQVVKSFHLEYKERTEFIQAWMRNWNEQCYEPMQRLRHHLRTKGKLVHNLIYYNS